MAKACRSCAKIFWKAFRMESCYSKQISSIPIQSSRKWIPTVASLPHHDVMDCQSETGSRIMNAHSVENIAEPPLSYIMLHRVVFLAMCSQTKPRLSSHNFNQFTLSLQCVSLWRKWPSKKENMRTWSYMNSAMWFSYIFMRSSKRLYAPMQLEPHETTRGDLVHILMQRHLAFREGRSARSWDLVMLSIDEKNG